MAPPFKDVVIRPLTGIFDGRSSTDEIPPGAFQWKQSFAISPDGKLCRALGFQRFFKTVCETNHDRHEVDEREPITMGFASVSNAGVRKLYIGTKTRLEVLDEAAGTWTNIASGLGQDSAASLTQLRFRAAELQNKIIFTNNFDLPKIHTLGTGSVGNIAELATLDEPGPLTKARVVISFQGFIFLMNTEENGTRIASRIRWCDINNPEKWVPGGVGNTADYQDLPYGEKILNAIILGGSLFVLTDSTIWRCGVSVDLNTATVSLNCVALYREPKNKARCLAYPNTLTTDGLSLWYLGADGVFRYTPGQDQIPERVEWVHRATSVIFKDEATAIDERACESPVMEFHPATNDDDSAGMGELHLSWPTYQPIEEEAEGEVDCEDFTATPPAAGYGVNDNTLVINVTYKTCDYREYGSTMLINFRLDTLATGDCNQAVVFISANGEDWTLKELDIGQLREMYDNVTETYSEVGYYSILRGVLPLERFPDEKEISSFLVEHEPVNPEDTAVFQMRFGTSDQALSPNAQNGRCSVIWRRLRDIGIKCAYTMTAEQYSAKNLRPRSPIQWNNLTRGRYIFFELKISKPNGDPPTTGGLTLSHFEVAARLT